MAGRQGSRRTGQTKAKSRRRGATRRRRTAKRGVARRFGLILLGVVLGIAIGFAIARVAVDSSPFSGTTGGVLPVASGRAPAPLPLQPPLDAAASSSRAAPPAAVPAREREAAALPTWRRHAVAVAADPGRPAIAVVIDDLGLDRIRTARTVELPGPLTLSFLPYAVDLDEQTVAARRGGHELLVHLPAEPDDAGVDPGPAALLIDLPETEMRRRIDRNLGAFSGFVGLNNHMGSRFTADRRAMAILLDEVARRGLLYLDSKTTTLSVGNAAALEAGVPFAARDVFIDHLDDPIAIRDRLAEAEAVARRNGYAVAIGHPRDHTLDALEDWLKDVARRGFRLVPVSAVAARRSVEG